MRKYTKQEVEEAIKKSLTWAQVCRELGIKPATGSQSNLTRRAKLWGLDYAHFVGKSFNKGRSFPQMRRDIQDYLKLNGPFINSHILKEKLFKAGIKKRECEDCFINKWLGIELPLELDHVNSDRKDNRIENLRVLCPNCHSIKTRKDRAKKPI